MQPLIINAESKERRHRRDYRNHLSHQSILSCHTTSRNSNEAIVAELVKGIDTSLSTDHDAVSLSLSKKTVDNSM